MRESELLEQAASKRVLFVGETIRDVYHYVRPLGRPTKDAIVSVELASTEEFVGGVIAAKAHLADFMSRAPECCTSAGYVTKTRFVEGSHIRKLFEFYRWDGEMRATLPVDLQEYDAVIVTDYGHGMVDEAMVDELCAKARYLAVNVQTNSGNYGFNLAHKYPCCHFLCVDEPEARLATQRRSGAIEATLAELAEIAPKLCVTLGKEGAVGYHHGMIHRSSAFTDSVVDTMGAGDAFFALTALVAEQAEMPELLRIGNAAGAIKAGIVGHRDSVTKEGLIELLGTR